MTYKPFLIAGMPRTGSNLLTTTVWQHPEILTYLELFHPIVSERAGPHAIRRDGAALYFDEESADPVDFLRRWVWSEENRGYRAVGFKIFVEYVRAKSTHRLLERLREEVAGLHVLHIRRANYLDVYVSRLVANKTERWINSPDEGTPTDGTGDIRLVISPDAATRFFQAMEEADACIEGLCEGGRYLKIDYEHLSRSIQDQANAVFAFLGVEERTVVPAIQKQVTARKEDLVLNYEDLRRYFSGSAYEAFFAADEGVSQASGSANPDAGGASGARQGGIRPSGDSQPRSLEALDERILGAINDGLLGLQGPPYGPQPCIFLPADPEILRTLPGLRTAARGNLDRINGIAAYENLTLRRSAPIFFLGWCCRTEQADGCADSRYFFFQSTVDELRYYAHVLSRTQRDDVANAVPELADWATRFSGFDFLADLRHLQLGQYRLGVVHVAGGVRYEFVFADALTIIS